MKERADLDLPPLAERRAKPRNRVLLGAVAVYDNGKFSFRCRIRNIAADNARIVIPLGQILPSEIYLINLRSHTAHKAKVVWAREAEAGLHFLSSMDLLALTDPGLEYLKRIWSANSTRGDELLGSAK